LLPELALALVFLIASPAIVAIWISGRWPSFGIDGDPILYHSALGDIRLQPGIPTTSPKLCTN